MKKFLILDIGGVLVLSNRGQVFESWAAKLGKDVETVRKLVKTYNTILFQGKIHSVSDYLKSNRVNWIDETTFENLRKDLWRSEYVNKELIDYLLKHSNMYQYALLTNNFKGVEKLLDEKFQIPKFYQKIINSSEVGVTKPDPNIFDHALKVLNTKAENCIFVDDDEENVNAAKSTKMKGIVYTDLLSFKKELESKF